MVNHNEEFVSTEGIHINMIKGAWGFLHVFLNRGCLAGDSVTDIYLGASLQRNILKSEVSDRFDYTLEMIAGRYKVRQAGYPQKHL